MKPVGIIIAVILGIVFLTLIVAKELEFDLFRNEPEYSINTLEELCLVEDEIFGRSDLAQQYRNAKFQYSNRDPSDYRVSLNYFYAQLRTKKVLFRALFGTFWSNNYYSRN